VQIDLAALPDDPNALQQMLREIVPELQAENEKLWQLIQRLLRHRYGPRSEKLDLEQLQLVLEDAEQSAAEDDAAKDAAEPAERRRRIATANRNRGALPAHLPRNEVVIDVESKQCPCCGGTLHLIGEDRTEMLDLLPAQLRVKVMCRPRYGCRGCEGAVVQAPAPERPIDGGMATEALVAHIVVSKFCDALPLHRQAQMLKRQGITLDRSTLSAWVGRACWWLTPLYELVLGTVLSSDKLFADETTLPVLDPGRGKTRTGRLWCYAVDDRPWAGSTRPAAAYVYSEDRRGEHPTEHLAAFRGTLQVDGYTGFGKLVEARKDASLRLSFCWAHARRPFYEFYASTQSPLAAEVLARIAKLYAIEADVRGQPADLRRAVRQERSRPLVEDLHRWLQDRLPRLPGWSDLAKAMRYVLRHWDGLILYLDDGRLEMDTNVVERAIRPVCITRKNSLFAGSDAGARRWAIANTLIQTCKLSGVDPLAWLTDVLQRIVSGRTKSGTAHAAAMELAPAIHHRRRVITLRQSISPPRHCVNQSHPWCQRAAYNLSTAVAAPSVRSGH
jgi:transposase